MPLRASATAYHSVRSGQIPPSKPKPYDGKYHASAVEIVRNADGRHEIGFVQPCQNRAPLFGSATSKSTGKISSAVKLS